MMNCYFWCGIISFQLCKDYLTEVKFKKVLSSHIVLNALTYELCHFVEISSSLENR